MEHHVQHISEALFVRGGRGVGKNTLHCGIYPSAVILAVPQECRADPTFLPFSEPDSWVPVKKSFPAFVSLFFSVFSFNAGVSGSSVLSSPWQWSPGEVGRGMGAACKAATGSLALLNKGRLLKGVFWETQSLQRWDCV